MCACEAAVLSSVVCCPCCGALRVTATFRPPLPFAARAVQTYREARIADRNVTAVSTEFWRLRKLLTTWAAWQLHTSHATAAKAARALAADFYQSHTLSRTLAAWREVHADRARLTALSAAACATFRRRALKQHLTAWHQFARAAFFAVHVRVNRGMLSLTRVLRAWRRAAASRRSRRMQLQDADTYRALSLCVRHFVKWRNAAIDAVCCRRASDMWLLQYCGKALRAWRRYTVLAGQSRALHRKVAKASAARLQRGTLLLWARWANGRLAARAFRYRSLLARPFHRWVRAVASEQRTQFTEAAAMQFRVFSLLRMAFFAWKDRVRLRLLRAACREHYVEVLVDRVFRAWVALWRTARLRQQQVLLAHSLRCTHLAMRVWQHWAAFATRRRTKRRYGHCAQLRRVARRVCLLSDRPSVVAGCTAKRASFIWPRRQNVRGLGWLRLHRRPGIANAKPRCLRFSWSWNDCAGASDAGTRGRFDGSCLKNVCTCGAKWSASTHGGSLLPTAPKRGATSPKHGSLPERCCWGEHLTRGSGCSRCRCVSAVVVTRANAPPPFPRSPSHFVGLLWRQDAERAMWNTVHAWRSKRLLSRAIAGWSRRVEQVRCAVGVHLRRVVLYVLSVVCLRFVVRVFQKRTNHRRYAIADRYRSMRLAGVAFDVWAEYLKTRHRIYGHTSRTRAPTAAGASAQQRSVSARRPGRRQAAPVASRGSTGDRVLHRPTVARTTAAGRRQSLDLTVVGTKMDVQSAPDDARAVTAAAAPVSTLDLSAPATSVRQRIDALHQRTLHQLAQLPSRRDGVGTTPAAAPVPLDSSDALGSAGGLVQGVEYGDVMLADDPLEPVHLFKGTPQ